MSSQMVKGNTAVIVGALYAGCDCYFGYPITPASEVLHEASKYFPKVGRTFIQAESEEASINMIYGGASAGHRVMTASSGPGVSLMQEGFTYLAGAELPAVIVDVMRAGPGLGNIGPEQGDYNQVVKGGGHGNYKNIVLAPNSVQEMCDLTMKAFELADKYRNPVVVLADAVLGQMAEPLQFPERAYHKKPDNSWAVRGNKETKDNLVTSIFLDFDQLEDFNYYIQDKYADIEKNEVQYEGYKLDDAKIVLVSYGTSSRVARTAVDIARKKGVKVGLLRLITLFPFPKDKIAELSEKGCDFISVEMSNGQLREDVKSAAYCKDVSLVNRMGGNLIELQDILNRIYVNAGIDEEYKLHSKERKYYIDYTHDETYKDELDNDDILRHRVID
ncbi:MAG: 3-methyl-2-oxobutanoate dehydrogenase subunit VorB [Methanobacteriaceae archaeon]|jgi:2-oxoisovalerate ferredoxin oxidoreductase alpha subunit|uniref:3-methyl-2-oxobutanoate dehydrogenase subunit VorB n=1 Tax=unclassified Methanobrevibacter TaxID=2638681 RepID=UPI002A0CE463|nr:3-methyl-2-oxobutanoate dehydrogenase subunit VorB [Methanobacteriaceae archaeon]MDD3408499.1 3-methyl-2-oxobutanoate dehydrogenase subunit VorB [Methanobacteriaceae archaeon]MDD4594634.1 3-methyl-2-oxobutanoate dehydrogenase subunit VorB [Methanobacteriaceae archaeon]